MGRQVFSITVFATDEEWNYFQSCARIRHMDMTSLWRLVLKAVMRDQMVLAVLDDGPNYSKVRYARGYRGPAYPNHEEGK